MWIANWSRWRRRRDVSGSRETAQIKPSAWMMTDMVGREAKRRKRVKVGSGRKERRIGGRKRMRMGGGKRKKRQKQMEGRKAKK
jgi:hypothetical protein